MKIKDKILITGINGLLGSALKIELKKKNFQNIFGLNSKNLIQEIEKLLFSNLKPDTSEQNIQVYFVEKVLELIDDNKLHPSIKSFLIGLRKNMNKKFLIFDKRNR